MPDETIPALVNPVALLYGFEHAKIAKPEHAAKLQPIQFGSEDARASRQLVVNQDGIEAECVCLRIDLEHGAHMILLMNDFQAVTVMLALGKAIQTVNINGILTETLGTTTKETKQ